MLKRSFVYPQITSRSKVAQLRHSNILPTPFHHGFCGSPVLTVLSPGRQRKPLARPGRSHTLRPAARVSFRCEHHGESGMFQRASHSLSPVGRQCNELPDTCQTPWQRKRSRTGHKILCAKSHRMHQLSSKWPSIFFLCPRHGHPAPRFGPSRQIPAGSGRSPAHPLVNSLSVAGPLHAALPQPGWCLSGEGLSPKPGEA